MSPCLPLLRLVYIPPESANRGSITNLDEWLQQPPQPLDEEPEPEEPEEEVVMVVDEEEEEEEQVQEEEHVQEVEEYVQEEEEPAQKEELVQEEEGHVQEEEEEEEEVQEEEQVREEEQVQEEEVQEVQEVSQQPEVLEILEEDVEESGPSPGPIEEPVQPQPIEVPSDTVDFEHNPTPPPQELEPHEETLPTSPAPIEPTPPTPTPAPAIEEVLSETQTLDSQLSPPTPSPPSPAPVTPKFEEEQDAIVDVLEISDEEELQSCDSHIDNFPPTPPPTMPATIDTTLLYRGPDQPMIVAPPSPVHDPQYDFDADFSFDTVKSLGKDKLPYTLPLLNTLPPEFRKKTTRTQRKREKERERTEVRKEKEDWAPMGMARWRALLRANPTWQHLARSTKSLTTKDWNVSLGHIPDPCRSSL